MKISREKNTRTSKQVHVGKKTIFLWRWANRTSIDVPQ